MKRILNVLFLLVFVTACSNDTSSPRSAELPITPFPDTPSPAEIDVPRVEEPALLELNMFNELDGWGVTDTQTVRTNDGGITWYDATPPDVTELGFSVDTFILDNNHAWLQKPDFENFPNSGFMYRTTDGGLTWASAATPFSRGDVSFVDPNNGWALADLGVGAGSNAVSVYQTTNGGATWQQTYINDPNSSSASDSLPLGGLKSDLVPLNMKTAWVTGVVYAPGEVYLYRTDDGGHNWDRVSIDLPAGAENFELGIDRDQMQFVSPTEGFIVLRMAGDATQTVIYVTQDGGDTWSLASAVLDGAGATDFLSAQELVMYDGEQFHVTRDAARTWVAVSPDVAFGESFASMEFVNTLAGWVITLDPTTNQRSLYRTHDGGATWLPVMP